MPNIVYTVGAITFPLAACQRLFDQIVKPLSLGKFRRTKPEDYRVLLFQTNDTGEDQTDLICDIVHWVTQTSCKSFALALNGLEYSENDGRVYLALSDIPATQGLKTESAFIAYLGSLLRKNLTEAEVALAFSTAIGSRMQIGKVEDFYNRSSIILPPQCSNLTLAATRISVVRIEQANHGNAIATPLAHIPLPVTAPIDSSS